MMLQGPQVEPVAKNIPEIIKQASQSDRGILALLIIVLFGLSFYFFRKAPILWRVLIFLLFFAGVVAYAIEINRVASKPEAVHYVGHVLDAVTSAPLHEARVIVSIGKGKPDIHHSDSDGLFSFWLARHKATEDAVLRFEHDEYKTYDRNLPSDVNNELGEIHLTPLSASAVPPEPQPGSGSSPTPPSSGGPMRSSARPTAMLSPSVVAAAAEITRSARPSSAPTSTMVMRVSVPPPNVVEVSSGGKLSGKGKDWSPWYHLRTDAAPSGYTVEKAEFWLSGDRSCGAGAECKEVAKNDSEVRWDFRLQGHDEWGAPPQTYSEGHLRVTYKSK